MWSLAASYRPGPPASPKTSATGGGFSRGACLCQCVCSKRQGQEERLPEGRLCQPPSSSYPIFVVDSDTVIRDKSCQRHKEDVSETEQPPEGEVKGPQAVCSLLNNFLGVEERWSKVEVQLWSASLVTEQAPQCMSTGLFRLPLSLPCLHTHPAFLSSQSYRKACIGSAHWSSVDTEVELLALPSLKETQWRFNPQRSGLTAVHPQWLVYTLVHTWTLNCVLPGSHGLPW